MKLVNRLSFAFCFIFLLIGCQTEQQRHIKTLVQKIKYKNTASVPEIENELVQLGIESVPYLIEALEIKKINHQIEKILVEIGNNSVTDLILALQHRNPLVRRRAARTLSKIGLNAQPTLIQLLVHEDSAVQCHAIWALGKLKRKSRNVILALIKSLRDKNENVRSASALVLARLGSGQCVPDLVEKLNDEDNRVRSNSAYALGCIGNKSADAIFPLLKLLNDKEPIVRLSASQALEKIGIYAMPILIKELQNEDLMISGMTASILLRIGSSEAISAVSQMLPNLILMLKMPGIRPSLEKVIDRLGEEVVPHLIVLLKDSNAEVRLSVTKIIGQMGSKAQEGIPALIDCFQDQKWEVRIQAEEALGRMGEDAVPALIQELESPDQDVRILATKSLGRIGKDAYDAISLLIEGLQDSSSGVRWQSSLALRKIGENAVPALIQELQNPNLEVCHSAARILGQIGSDAEIAVPILIQLVQNEDESARRLANTLVTSSVAIEALEGIGTMEALNVVAKYDENKRLR